MSLLVFDIEFDHPNDIFYAGFEVTGRVIIHNTKPKRMRGVSLRLKGEAQVKWTDCVKVTRHGKSFIERDIYQAHELYVHLETWLIGAPHGEIILPPGEHEFPFSCSLPQNVPSSFEGTRGHIRYTTKVKINRTDKLNYKIEDIITVLNPLDLNLEKNILEPVEESKDKFLYCCCCRIGPVSINVKVFRGYVPGQRIEAIIECDNMTRGEVTLSFYLEKMVKYHGRFCTLRKTVSDNTVVAEKNLGVVGINSSYTWTTNIEVPPLPASYLRKCRCIDIFYQLVVKGKSPGLHKDINITVPIVIGTIPLKKHFNSIISSASEIPDSCGMNPPQDLKDALEKGDKDALQMLKDGSVAEEAEKRDSPDESESEEGEKNDNLSAPNIIPGVPYPDMPLPSFKKCMQDKEMVKPEEEEKFPKEKINLEEGIDSVKDFNNFIPHYPVYIFCKD